MVVLTYQLHFLPQGQISLQGFPKQRFTGIIAVNIGMVKSGYARFEHRFDKIQ